jgi:hypothetical protein
MIRHLDIKAMCVKLGGTRPLHPATIHRAVQAGTYHRRSSSVASPGGAKTRWMRCFSAFLRHAAPASLASRHRTLLGSASSAGRGAGAGHHLSQVRRHPTDDNRPRVLVTATVGVVFHAGGPAMLLSLRTFYVRNPYVIFGASEK